jgi:hypothetical protein
MASQGSTPAQTNAAITTSGGATVTKSQVARLLGRNQGPEFFYQAAWVPLSTIQIPKNVNLNRPLERIIFRLDVRITISGADMTTVYPEALQSLIQQVTLQGQHNVYGALVPIQLTGSDIFAWPSLFKTRGNRVIINGARVTSLGYPNGLPMATFGNIGTYDCQIFWELPLVPVLPVASKLNSVPFLYMQTNWGDTLNLQLIMADGTALGVQGAGGSVAFSALGSASGTPQFYVYTNYEILGPLANQLTTAVTVRAIQQVPPGNISAATAASIKLAQLQKYKTLNAVLKSGTLAAGTSPGVSVYATLTDQLFEQTQIKVDNKPLRNNLSNITYKDYLAYAFDSIEQPQGYLPMTFIDSLNPRTAFDGDKVSAGSTYEVDSQILVTNSASQAEIIQEYFQGTPAGSGS